MPISAMPDSLRFQRMNTCAGCPTPCPDGQRCALAREPLRSYSGIRFTSDGFDCALPVAIDSHSMCSYGCLYCFSDNLISHREGRDRPIGQTSLRSIETIFAGDGGKGARLFRLALKYDRRNDAGYPCPVQLGALNDPCDHIERQQGWLLRFIELAIKYQQPVRISTKGTIMAEKDYLLALTKAPHLFWVAFSIITPDDEIIERIDRQAPNATQRLRAMAVLSREGVKTSLRFRPILPGVSDCTAQYPEAYRVLIEKAAQAGASAISYEVAFAPGIMTAGLRWRWERLHQIVGIPYIALYKRFGGHTACLRPPYTWTENIMHAICFQAHRNGLQVGVSDPVWKQLTDTGCCCGIAPDDPVFGNWQRESATNQLLVAKQTGKLLGPDDIIPAWAREVPLQQIVNLGAGPLKTYRRRHATWADKLHATWNDLKGQRGPLNYFQGALLPVKRDGDGDLYYRYAGLKRRYPAATPFWHVPQEG